MKSCVLVPFIQIWNLDDSLVCSIKKTVVSWNAYPKDLMYLKRNTKFQPDRWGLQTSLASQSSLNEIVFRRHKVTQTENVQTYENFRRFLQKILEIYRKL
jgi:hypothetical protein